MTGRGWSFFGLGFGLWVWARLLGIPELMQVAVAVVVLCLASYLWVRFKNRGIAVSRVAQRTRAHRGDSLEFEVLVVNPHPSVTPPIAIEEDIPGSLEGLRYELGPLTAGESRFIATTRMGLRGRFWLGGPSAVLTDPFRIARHRRRFSDPISILVYPRIQRLSAPGRRAVHGESMLRAPAPQGEDFFGMREYASGDDPRRIHWPTTARMGTLIVREEEVSGRDRVTVMLDDRASAQTPESFEWAVEAAASAIDLYLRMGRSVRLARAGAGGRHGRGTGHYQNLLEELAVANPIAAAEEALSRIVRRGNDESLVVVSGEMEISWASTISKAAGRYGEVIVAFPPGNTSSEIHEERLRRLGVRVVAPHAGEPLAQAWERSIKEAGWSEISVPI